MNGGLLGILILLTIVPIIFVPEAYAQSTLNVTETVPCFLNYTGSSYITDGDPTTTTGLEMLQNCNFEGDFISATTISFDWVTGGLFPMIVVSVLIIMTYLKYQTGIYPIAIGVVYLPFVAWAYPDEFISYALVVGAVIGAGAILTAIIKQTKEY